MEELLVVHTYNSYCSYYYYYYCITLSHNYCKKKSLMKAAGRASFVLINSITIIKLSLDIVSATVRISNFERPAADSTT